MKTCKWCDKQKPLGSFSRNVNAEDGRQEICNQCHYEEGTGMRKYRPSPEARAPYKPRRSPYENMASVLNEIEAHVDDVAWVRNVIVHARKEYSL